MLLSTLDPINEVYFGKTPELQRMENQLGIFRSKYLDNYIMIPTVNSDPDLLRFNRMMEDFFGFGCFSLHVINQASMNAFTYPIDMRYDVFNTNKNLLVDKNHYKFNKKADYTCVTVIYSGLIFNPGFTTEEIMACILHEVGHNFYSAIDRTNGVAINLYSAITFMVNLASLFTGNVTALSTIENNTEIYQKIVGKIRNFLRDHNSILIKIKDYFDFICSIPKNIALGVINIIDIFTLGLLGYLGSILTTRSNFLNPLTYVFLPILFDNERTADNFCTIYGYGPAHITLEEKMHSASTPSPSKIIEGFKQIPVFSDLYFLNTQVGNIIIHTFDSHPEEIYRCQDQIDLLERELAKENLDPKMKKVIAQDLKDCKKNIKLLIGTSEQVENKDMVRHVWNRLLYESFDSKALKEVILTDKNKFNRYDITYNEKIRR